MPESVKPHPERAALVPVVEALANAAGAALLEVVAENDMDEIALRPEGLLAVIDVARRSGFNLLLDIGGTDHHPLQPRFEISYHLTMIPVGNAVGKLEAPRIRLRVFCHGEDPTVPSLTHLWPSADWPEREIFDLFGIRFAGHPDLRRLLNPDDFVGYPLRKDFPLRGLERRFVPGGRAGAVPPVKES
ncbi:MAG TPA: NADH-quinone oxidoreductase subunit C [Candidatus Acidoferrales bacterium]|nr:NADH-quinone oxidoreductase subunit C [Candidatus Acidoferrales bacterium]